MSRVKNVLPVGEITVHFARYRNGMFFNGGNYSSTPILFNTIEELNGKLWRLFTRVTKYRYQNGKTVPFTRKIRENDLYVYSCKLSGEMTKTWYPKVVGTLRIPRNFKHQR